MSTITGLHHVTVNSGDPQENLNFYVGVLGLRLVKRTVNQDAPDTYHLFYADGAGNPGTEITFFPWRGMRRGRPGAGETSEIALAVPVASLDFWADRLAEHDVRGAERAVRFGEPVLTFTDPHGLRLALVETADAREFAAWAASPVHESQQIRGLHAIRITVATSGPTSRFLSEALDFEPLAEKDGWQRFGVGGGGSGRIVDVRSVPGMARAFSGAGSVHHVAFRVPDDASELVAQRQVHAAGGQPTGVINRFWFKSIYFREPGGALFEIATDGPGFAIDEDASTLGEQLILPPFLEQHRAEIERGLQPVTLPRVRAASEGILASAMTAHEVEAAARTS
jgi:glyoxalase family protein